MSVKKRVFKFLRAQRLVPEKCSVEELESGYSNWCKANGIGLGYDVFPVRDDLIHPAILEWESKNVVEKTETKAEKKPETETKPAAQKSADSTIKSTKSTVKKSKSTK